MQSTFSPTRCSLTQQPASPPAACQAAVVARRAGRVGRGSRQLSGRLAAAHAQSRGRARRWQAAGGIRALGPRRRSALAAPGAGDRSREAAAPRTTRCRARPPRRLSAGLCRGRGSTVLAISVPGCSWWWAGRNGAPRGALAGDGSGRCLPLAALPPCARPRRSVRFDRPVAIQPVFVRPEAAREPAARAKRPRPKAPPASPRSPQQAAERRRQTRRRP